MVFIYNCNRYGQVRTHQSLWAEQLDSSPYKGRISYFRQHICMSFGRALAPAERLSMQISSAVNLPMREANHSPLLRLKVECFRESCQYACHVCVWGSRIIVPYILNLGTRLR